MFYINQKRFLGVYVTIMLFAGLIFFRLYTIAVSDFGQILPALNTQHTRRLNIAERRGFIFDRYGEIIAGHGVFYATLIDPSKIGLSLELYQIPESIYSVAEILEGISTLSDTDILQRLRNGVPFVIQTHEALNNYYSRSFRMYKRSTDNSPAALHIIGYIDRDRQGVTGIEAVYNSFLINSGARVSAAWEADALGRSLRGMPIIITDYGYYYYNYNERAGLTLSLDWGLQKKVEQIADAGLNRGAIVVACVESGEILASTSRPVFSLDNLEYYIDSDNGEFINRAFGAFTPGSIFKTVVAAAALELAPDYYREWKYYCRGYINVFGQIFRCHRRWGHGLLDMIDAYANSCNPYFIELALHLGYDIIHETAQTFGIGEFGMLDGLRVNRGNIPNLSNPPPAFVANAAIGQDALLITPLEATRIFAAVANGGIMPELSLVNSFTFPREQETVDLRNTNSRRVFSERTAAYMQEMARAVVDTGTGVRAAPKHGTSAGKTSSAESGQFREITNDYGEVIREQIVHSWFAGFYPACIEIDMIPRYAITVIAEGGLNDDVHSTEIFREIANYLGERKSYNDVTS